MTDLAVARVKRLRKMYHFKLPDVHAKCTSCGQWCDSIIVAWVHSAQHGPFPQTPDGTKMHFDDLATAAAIAENLRRNNGS